jgi:hypothetical protein
MTIVAPEPLEFLEFFESEPFECCPEEGSYCYRIIDDNGIETYFSFSTIEGFIQVIQSINDREILRIVQEGAKKITIHEDNSGEFLFCHFGLDETTSRARIQVRPFVHINWHFLCAEWF